MSRKQNYLKYLTEIKPIKEYLRNTSKTDKTINTYLLALDKFFPYLVERFKSEISEINGFNYKEYFRLDEQPKSKSNGKAESYKIDFKKEWEEKNITNKIFTEKWFKLSRNIKSKLLMKWSNDVSELDNIVRKEKGLKELKDPKNTYLNYVWRIQGFLQRLDFKYTANPREMSKLHTNGFHLEDEITYEDVIMLYEELDKTKYKLILKIMIYCGLNPKDILLLKPSDFERYKSTKLFVLVKLREKTKNKDAQFLIVFHESFINELKEYFERAYDNQIWSKKNTKRIFDIKEPSLISDCFKYTRDKAKLNPLLMPSSIRRLCFTRLEDLFTISDKEIYKLWTQHKAGILTTHYITSLMKKFIKKDYIDKISKEVLIGSVKQYIKQIESYKESVSKIAELEGIVKSMSKILLNLNDSFRASIDDNYIQPLDDSNLGYNLDDMKEFRERIKGFLNKE
ncbi:MAG TPA: hypothetical protein ENI29_05630 [bacterium]|nr:hypothetical protein [bacterium]